MQNKFMELVEQSSMKPEIPHFEIGDTVDVHVRILEGEKERIQIFNGVVIARSGDKTREMFVVRRIVQGEGVERKFPVHSPRIADIVVKRSGKVRRAKLYYLRELSGKAVRLKERHVGGKHTLAEMKAAKATKRAARADKKKAKAAAKAAVTTETSEK
jgi:large subunit ribosomal protein L19